MRAQFAFVVSAFLVACALVREPVKPAPEPVKSPSTQSSESERGKPTSAPTPSPVPIAAPTDCAMSAWSEWTPWSQWHAVPDLRGWEMRLRVQTRTVVTPAANGGAPCSILMQTDIEMRWVGKS